MMIDNLARVFDESVNVNARVYKMKRGDIKVSKFKIEYMKNSENYYESSLIFKGDMIIKIGIGKPGTSYRFIYERHINNTTFKKSKIVFPKSSIDGVFYEYKIYALSDLEFKYEELRVLNGNGIVDFENLYDFLFPKIGISTDEELYYWFERPTSRNKSFYSFSENKIFLKENDSVDFGSYFNLFNINKWKKYTNVRNIGILIEFKGDIEVVVRNIKFDETECVYSNNFIKTNNKAIFVLEGIDIGLLETGLLAIKIRGVKDTEIYKISYLTKNKKIKNVTVGVGITTFKREEACVRAVNRLKEQIDNSEFSNKVVISVVDNGKTLKNSDFNHGVNLIYNENYGGTGGFMRNLLEYIKNGKVSHCLFMDDDASCDSSAIFRAITFLEHSVIEKVAVSGSMFSENNRFLQWENGAYFDRTAHSINVNFDLRVKEKVIKNEIEPAKYKIYGAWWFFMYPIKDVSNLCFPFFVRGDDIEFSYVNDFKVITLNGVCTWQEDFKLKESPLTIYLDTRSTLMQHVLLDELHQSRKSSLIYLTRMFMTFNNSYMYDSAKSIILGLHNFMQGPAFWNKNLDLTSIRKKIKTYTKTENNQNGIISNAVYIGKNINFGKTTKLVRLFTCYGHILPNVFLKDIEYLLNKYDVPNKNRVCFRKNIVVNNYKYKTHQKLTKNNLRYFYNLMCFVFYMMRFYFTYNKLKKIYSVSYKTYSKMKYWNDILKIK